MAVTRARSRALGLTLVTAMVAALAVSVPVHAGGNVIGDLSITKADSADPVVTGSTLTYTLTVSLAAATNTMAANVTDTLPVGVTYVSATPSQGTCSEAALVVSCSLGGIANNGSATVTIVVVTGAPGTLTNVATVSAVFGDLDPNPNNDSDTEVTTVTATATAPPTPSPSASPSPSPSASVLPDTAGGGSPAATGAGTSGAIAILSVICLLAAAAPAGRRRFRPVGR